MNHRDHGEKNLIYSVLSSHSVCSVVDSLSRNLFYLDRRIILTMTVGIAVTLSSPVLENDQFFAPALLHDLTGNLSRCEHGLAHGHRIALDDHEHFLDLGHIALLTFKALHPDNIAGCNLVLFSTALDHCVHATSSLRTNTFTRIESA